MKHIKVKIFGQVQGVGFRWCSYEKFVELGLTGKAENVSDGSVEISVAGEDFAVEKFVEWAKAGPQGARVTSVEVSEIKEPVTTKADESPSS